MNRSNLAFVPILGVLVLCLSAVGRGAEPAPPSVPVYIGAYTGPNKSKGIYLTRLDLASGALSVPELVAETTNPTYLALHPSQKFLFAVNEIAKYQDKADGSVSGFAIDAASGKLSPINTESSGGPGPCHLSLDPTGKHLLIGNYGGGSFEVLPVGDDGRLGAATCAIQHDKSDPKHQPRGHCILLDPAGRFALADDLGLDKIFVYRFDSVGGKLTPNEPAGADTAHGAGPRHCAFHPDGKWVYNINELNSTMNAYAYDAEHGTLTELQSLSTLPKSFSGKNSCAEVQVHPSGKFVYGSNRGDDSIVGFAIDPATGKMTSTIYAHSGGKMPRNFAIDPSGNWLLAANQDTGNVVVFRIDPQTGDLKPTGRPIEVAAAVCITFVPPQAAGK